MKYGQLLITLLLGGMLGYGLANYFLEPKQETDYIKEAIDSASFNTKWSWPDSLDAVNAAPKNHNIVYEDSNVRILQVLLDGHKEEPVHTHKWKSVMWITKPAVPCIIYQYKLNKGGDFVALDSVRIPHMDTNIGGLNDAEGPTGIKNLSNDNGIAYRVEFKKDFKK